MSAPTLPQLQNTQRNNNKRFFFPNKFISINAKSDKWVKFCTCWTVLQNTRPGNRQTDMMNECTQNYKAKKNKHNCVMNLC